MKIENMPFIEFLLHSNQSSSILYYGDAGNIFTEKMKILHTTNDSSAHLT